MSRENGTRVLVVDDHVDGADSMAMLLGLWGYIVRTCYGGASALETALTYRPQVVLLDVGMNGIDGFTVARRLRDQPGTASPLIIGISGFGDNSHRCRALAEGFDHYLVKPVELDDLQALLRGVAFAGDGATPAAASQEMTTLAAARPPPLIDSPHFVSGHLLTHPCFLRQEESGSPRPAFTPDPL